MRRPLVAVQCRSFSGARRAKCCSSAHTTCRSISEPGLVRSFAVGQPMRRSFRRGLALGAASGLAAVLLAEATRPRGGTAVLLDWDEVTRIARTRLREERADAALLTHAAA